MIDFQKFEDVSANLDPYPYFILKNIFSAENRDRILQDFPEVNHPGSVPIEAIEGGAAFKELIDDLDGDQFRNIIEKKFDVDLADKPIMTTVRGVMRQKDGRIHTDSKSKLITVLIYFNDDWQSESGNLRLLNGGDDLENYFEEIVPEIGTMLVFKVTDNCWHGHKPVVGKRLSLQMNYMAGGAAKGKHEFFHALSSKVKNLLSPAK